MDTTISGVGVIDKAAGILAVLEDGPASLADLVTATGLSRPTAHRLARALEDHGLVRRDGDGRFALGLRLAALGRAAADGFDLSDAAHPALESLVVETGESAQLYVRQGDHRVCVLALESDHGLRTIVPVGSRLPLDRGSGGRVLLGQTPSRGWIESAGERVEGVASVSSPVHDRSGQVIAAVSVSGPIPRTTRQPGRRYGAAVVAAARAVESALRA